VNLVIVTDTHKKYQQITEKVPEKWVPSVKVPWNFIAATLQAASPPLATTKFN